MMMRRRNNRTSYGMQRRMYCHATQRNAGDVYVGDNATTKHHLKDGVKGLELIKDGMIGFL